MKCSTRPRTIWLTGASSGIGKALLERLVEEGHQVVATARSPEQLEDFRQQWGDAVIPLAADTRSREDMERCGRFLQALPRLDWAILNAGTCEYLDVKAFSADLVERVFATNVVGTARCIEAALPALRRSASRQASPRLAVVSSSAWWFPFTRAEAYGGSKAALTYFAQSLRADLAAEGIAVSVISPGFVETPLTAQNDFDMPFLISAPDAAQRILRGLYRGKNEIAFPRRFTFSLRLLGLLPGPLRDRLAASLSRNNGQSHNSRENSQ